MRACVLTGIKKTAITDIPKPEPGPGEVLVKVTHVGICGSDVHYWAKGRIGDTVIEYPFVVGHEVSGVVEALGSGVPGGKLEPGVGVAIEPGIPCWNCPACLKGLPHCCPNVRFFGTPPTPGAFCEYVVSVPRNLVPVPEGVTLQDAAVIEPLGVAVHAVAISTMKPGMKVGVFGAGPIGLMTLQVVRAGGGTPVYATELIPERMEVARTMGAEKVVDAREKDAGRRIAAETGGLDLAFEAAGTAEAVNDAIASVRAGGCVVVIGIPDPGPTPIDFHTARRKELKLLFSRRSNFETEESLRLLEKGLVTTKGYVTHSFPLERIAEGFELVESYRDGVIKAMIEVG